MKNIPLNPVRPTADLKQMLAGSAAEFGDRPAFLRKDRPDAPYTPVSFRQLSADVGALGTALLELGPRRPAGRGRRREPVCLGRHLSRSRQRGGSHRAGRPRAAGGGDPALPGARRGCRPWSSPSPSARSWPRSPGSPGPVRRFIDMRLGADAAGALSFERLLERGRALLQAGRRDYLDRAIDPEAMSVLLFTSGTTSEVQGGPAVPPQPLRGPDGDRGLYLDRPRGRLPVDPADPPHLRVHVRLPRAALLRRDDRLLRRAAPHPAQPAGIEVHVPGRGPPGARDHVQAHLERGASATAARAGCARRSRPATRCGGSASTCAAACSRRSSRPSGPTWGPSFAARPRWRRTSPRAFATSGSSSCRATG